MNTKSNLKRSVENCGDETPKESEHFMCPRFNQSKPDRDVVVLKSTIGANLSKVKTAFQSKMISKETITEEPCTSKSIPEVQKFDVNNHRIHKNRSQTNSISKDCSKRIKINGLSKK